MSGEKCAMNRYVLRAKLFFGLYLFSFGLACGGEIQAAGAALPEQLTYKISYQGIFSGFIHLDIARADLRVAGETVKIAGRVAKVATLKVTTEPYRKAEVLFPVRYQYRSWYEPNGENALLVTESLQADEISNEMIWFDRDEGVGHRYEVKATASDGGKRPPLELLQKFADLQVWPAVLEESYQQGIGRDEMFDHLSMMQRLRVLDLQPGQVLDLPVFTGKQLKNYRVVVTSEPIEGKAEESALLKLQIFSYDAAEDDVGQKTYIWLSADDQRVPLRFYAERAFGYLEAVLESGESGGKQRSGFTPATNAFEQLEAFYF